ncbi:MAG: 2-oxoglutarate dehydrogenase E1 component [Bdellovibrionaceae bacterium]|nr:2-oxoglutarate dehydrogenase E1 component [Pseudobdellovibrionaceae bacterium]
MYRFNYLRSLNTEYIEDLYSQYQKDPFSVEPSWKSFFDGMELSEEWNSNESSSFDLAKEAKVGELISGYRSRGHVIANIDPLSQAPESHPLLDLEYFGLSSQDLEQEFNAGHLIGLGTANLSKIIHQLKQTYCSTIGAEFTHIQDPESREWIQEKLERDLREREPDSESKKFILKRLTDSETFERFLHTRYVAQKRFSIEGGESLIPTLDRIVETGSDLGAEIFVMGMAHRGRLNVLHNIYGKNAEYIFTEFEQNYENDSSMGEGDVKYHMGYSSDQETRNGKKVHLSLASNPSHLEFVNPVVEGVTRSKQRDFGEDGTTQVIPILIHGDAAFAGQGVVYETLNLSQLEGYWTGGTIHIIIDNQVGFTTNPEDARSTPYPTDMAKMLQVPIFHVNGDDPEALWYVARLATEYRQKFKKDVFIELKCYRKYGHNEGDEPSFTQPLLYSKIKKHASPREIYAERLSQINVVSPEESKNLVDQKINQLTESQKKTREEKPKPFVSAYKNKWSGMKAGTGEDLFKDYGTQISESMVHKISDSVNTIKEGFQIHPKLNRVFEHRKKAINEKKGLDWGNAEALAFGSLLLEGTPIRMTGQDVERGTFSHRHAVLNNVETGEKWTPLNHITDQQEKLLIHNSNLSETAVLGFEYGWSLDNPQSLVIWEAQFGDFANGAQVIIDQFIASAESKWRRGSGIVLLLPHGYEGQGPEHSSARLERFLQLCGKENMAVCNFTSPANFFHALRRQVKRDFRKPMIVMTPKSLLRHPMAVSTLDEFTQGEFKPVFDDPAVDNHCDRVLLCTGKIYYDLLAKKQEAQINNVAIVRMEQIYPWPKNELKAILDQYPNAEIFWVQEEPQNMGAWLYLFGMWMGALSHEEPLIQLLGGRGIAYIGREKGAAPAVGSSKIHTLTQNQIILQALGIKTEQKQ